MPTVGRISIGVSDVPRYVAFLRAINVGGRTVRMEQLRTEFAAMGFADVETFIASGNVIFRTRSGDAAALERRIEKHLQASLGYPVGAFLRSIPELHEIAQHQPFNVLEGSADKISVYVILLAERLSAAAERKLLTYRSDTDDFAVKGREIYWQCRGSLLDSPFSGTRLEGTAGAATMRNRNTIVRLAKKYPI
jgi:uncharacterized protein (DUF1697 family)